MAVSVSENTRELPPAGLHLAICTDLVEMGTSIDTFGDESKPRRKVWLSFELCDEKRQDKDENEFCLSIGSTYTASLGKEAKLRKVLESWRSRPFTVEELAKFDLKNILGKPCMITIVHKAKSTGGQKAEISAISPTMKNQPIPAQTNPTRLIDFEEFDQAAYDSLPDFLKNEIARSDEYKAMMGESPASAFKEEPVTAGGDSDDLPF